MKTMGCLESRAPGRLVTVRARGLPWTRPTDWCDWSGDPNTWKDYRGGGADSMTSSQLQQGHL